MERERQRDRGRDRDRERERGREGLREGGDAGLGQHPRLHKPTLTLRFYKL